MLKSVSRFLFALLLLSVFLPRASAQKSAADYWPMQVGNVWKFAERAGDIKFTGTMKVIRVTKSGGAKIAVLSQYIKGNEVFREKYRITSDAICRVSGGTKDDQNTLSPPLPILKFPAHNGDSWDWEGKFHYNDQDNDAMAHVTVSGPETVKTPAGTYKAMKIHLLITLDMNGQKMEMPTDYYLAPGIGLVRQTGQLGDLHIDGKLISVKLKK